VIVSCPVLTRDGKIPVVHAYGGVPGAANLSLPISWNDVPPGTRSFLLTIIDRHPVARRWVHWCVVNIPASIRSLPEGASGNRVLLPGGCVEVENGFGEPGYGGPMPPKGSGPHDYVITLHALSVERLTAGREDTMRELENRIEGKVLASASVVGIFER
jgi:Raf kinase inhibitor-like YbhB/YbcL family protein